MIITPFEFGLFILGFIFVCGVFLILFRKKPKIPNKLANKFIRKINDTRSLDSAHAILNAHKYFVAAISVLFPDSKLSAAKKISKISSSFPNEKNVWYFHKLRNRIAHEVEIKVYFADAENARRHFTRAIKSLTKK
ncbi:hypothetical protein KAI58_04420 [Candidatus Gracilibacteria bacterium]|nr:hypothetical protein [Candidatus Gracilibacteria bacterium]